MLINDFAKYSRSTCSSSVHRLAHTQSAARARPEKNPLVRTKKNNREKMSAIARQFAAPTGATMGLGFSSIAREGLRGSSPKRAAVTPLRASYRNASCKRRVLVVYAAARGGAGPVVAASSAGLDKINVLVVGGGGREHALCWRLRQSQSCDNLYCTPGNAGINVEEGVQTVTVNETDHAAVVAFCKENDIGECAPDRAGGEFWMRSLHVQYLTHHHKI